MKLVCNVSILALFTVFNIAVAEDKNLESQKAEGTARKSVDAFISGDLQTLGFLAAGSAQGQLSRRFPRAAVRVRLSEDERR